MSFATPACGSRFRDIAGQCPETHLACRKNPAASVHQETLEAGAADIAQQPLHLGPSTMCHDPLDDRLRDVRRCRQESLVVLPHELAHTGGNGGHGTILARPCPNPLCRCGARVSPALFMSGPVREEFFHTLAAARCGTGARPGTTAPAHLSANPRSASTRPSCSRASRAATHTPPAGGRRSAVPPPARLHRASDPLGHGHEPLPSVGSSPASSCTFPSRAAT